MNSLSPDTVPALSPGVGLAMEHTAQGPHSVNPGGHGIEELRSEELSKRSGIMESRLP